MGRIEETEPIPDLFGLPEYFVTKIHSEIMGNNVRYACGVRRGGSVQWVCSIVMPAAEAMASAQECGHAAQQAWNISQLLDRRKGH